MEQLSLQPAMDQGLFERFVADVRLDLRMRAAHLGDRFARRAAAGLHRPRVRETMLLCWEHWTTAADTADLIRDDFEFYLGGP